ncbi:MAG: hypothetical protein P4L51_09935 [Puia sp.]|nr:hypothetical protein [Puia sp.]
MKSKIYELHQKSKMTVSKKITQLNQTISNRSKKAAVILALLLTATTGYTFANGTAGSNESDKKSEMALNNGRKTIGVDSARTSTSAILENNNDGGDMIASPVSASFRQDFKNVELIRSEVGAHFTTLTFRTNDMILMAFYTEKGELIATTHNILSTQLPIKLLMDLKKDYKGYWITELFELNGKGQDAYYISLENADTKISLRSNEYSAWEVYRHAEKK